jgi:hypothetical protein
LHDEEAAKQQGLPQVQQVAEQEGEGRAGEQEDQAILE